MLRMAKIKINYDSKILKASLLWLVFFIWLLNRLYIGGIFKPYADIKEQTWVNTYIDPKTA